MNSGRGTFRSVSLNAIYMKRIFRPTHIIYNFTFSETVLSLSSNNRWQNEPSPDKPRYHLQAYSFCTQTSYRCHVMTDKQDCPSLSFRYILHLANSLLSNSAIPTANTSSTTRISGSRWAAIAISQIAGHTRRITFHWSIDIFLHTGESHNLIQLAGNLPGHPHDGTIHINILPSCHFGMKACLPTSSKEAIRPRARMQPAVGEVTRERIFNKVDFPPHRSYL